MKIQLTTYICDYCYKDEKVEYVNVGNNEEHMCEYCYNNCDVDEKEEWEEK